MVVGSTRKVLRWFVCWQTNMNLLAFPVFKGILLLGVVCDAKAMLKLETNKKNYDGAVQQCSDNGGHLVLPLNRTQNMELIRLLSGSGKAWLYLDSPFGRITQPSAMTQMTFVRWAMDHPDSSKGVCVRIKKNKKWESADCSRREIFVCESGPRPQTASTLLPTTETNEPDDNNPGPTSEGNATMRPHIETSSIAPAHRDASLSSSNTGVIIGATMAVLVVIAALVIGVYIMRRRSVSRSRTGGDVTLGAENKVACNTYEEVEPSIVSDVKNPGVGQGKGYTSVNLDPDNEVTHYQALHSPGTHANGVTAVVRDNDLFLPGSSTDDVGAVVQDNELYSPGSIEDDVSAVVQDNDLYSPGFNADDVSAVVQDNDLYSPGTDAEAVSGVILESSHGFDRNIEGMSIPLQDATE